MLTILKSQQYIIFFLKQTLPKLVHDHCQHFSENPSSYISMYVCDMQSHTHLPYIHLQQREKCV